MNDNCSICKCLCYIKTKEYDCCDVRLYKCEVTNKILDEFHIERKSCSKFKARDWVSA